MADRNIRDVIKQLLAVIPADQKQLIERLQWLDSGSIYCPPEHTSDLWATCRNILITEVGEPKLDWQVQVEAIFSNKKG